jgi:hypothetical protein
MASRPEHFRPVDAHGTLRIDTPSGRSLNLVAEGETLRLELPGWADTRGVLPRSLRGRIQAARFVANLLSVHGLTLSLESAGRAVVRLGHNTRASWLARLLRLGPTSVSVPALRLLFQG